MAHHASCHVKIVDQFAELEGKFQEAVEHAVPILFQMELGFLDPNFAQNIRLQIAEKFGESAVRGVIFGPTYISAASYVVDLVGRFRFVTAPTTFGQGVHIRWRLLVRLRCWVGS